MSAEMPKYECHKTVHALKIAGVEYKTDDKWESRILTPEDTRFAPFEVDSAYVRKHDPQAGGYHVVYADGYKSFSPAEAFESGYTRLSKEGCDADNDR